MHALLGAPVRGVVLPAAAPRRTQARRRRGASRVCGVRAELLPVRANPLAAARGTDGTPLTVLAASDGRCVSVADLTAKSVVVRVPSVWCGGTCAAV